MKETLLDNEFFKHILEHSKEGISVLNKLGKIIYQSPSNNSILGYSDEEILSINYLSLIHPDDYGFALELYDRIFFEKHKSIAADLRLLHKNGFYVYCAIKANNLFEIDQVQGIVVSFRDISENKTQEERISKINSQLKRKNEELEDFTYIATHNLSSPIANINGILNLIDLNSLSEVNLELIEKLKILSTQLDQNIKVLSEAIMSSNDTGEKYSFVKFEEVVKEVQIELGHLIDKVDLQVQTDLTIDKIRYYKSHIHNIFFNLLSNSLKYRKPDQPLYIRISTVKDQDHLKLTFSDNGIGIDLDKHKDKIFKLFSRVTTKTEIEGKGMGLYILKKQIEQNNGLITVESTIGEGTTFNIHLKEFK